VRLVDGLLEHESLPELAGGFAPASAPQMLASLKENRLLKHPLPRFAARGSLEAALLSSGAAPPVMLAVWDSGFVSPLLRFLPAFSRFITVPNLYYVQAGKLSRFEYRLEGNVFFIGVRRNLLVICNNQSLFEELISGNGEKANTRQDAPALKPEDFDITLFFSSPWLTELFAAQDSSIASVLRNIEFSGNAEAGISISRGKLEVQLTGTAASANAALRRFLDQRSPAPDLAERLPASTQYGTILSDGSLAELYDAAAVFAGQDLSLSVSRADSSSRLLLGMSLEELLFSWSGREFAVFGLEGRPHPVYAVQVADEQKRQEVFNRAFKSIVLGENVQLNLDGVRVPRIEVPDFLLALLQKWNLRIPSPYYTVHKDYLLLSESAETLLTAVRAMQRNDVLPKTPLWRGLSGAKSDSSAFLLYYSLDRSLPFFLRGNTALSAMLRVYRQGLLRMGFDRGRIELNLSLIPGQGRGLALMSGYPFAPGGNPQNRLAGILAGKSGENRILLGRDGSVISINPVDNSIAEFDGQRSPQGQTWVIAADGLTVKSALDPAAWVVGSQGRVNLVSGGMETAKGFPVSTGLRLSAPPAAHDGKLYLCDEDGKVLVIDSKGLSAAWETSFPAALRSPPSFLNLPRSGTYAAAYPKSFFGEIWLLDGEGRAKPNWPAPVSGIAFGGPLLFAHNNMLRLAFITQAGELSVFDETAAPVPPFPLELEGVFYVQPVFDGNFLWLVSDNGNLFRVSMEGEILYQNIPRFRVMEEGYITAVDADGDKTPEIFISGEGNALYGYSRNFRSLEGFPLPVWGRPLFADLNGDGKIECAGIGMDKQLYRWQFR
jgi:hypothetical protein